MNEVGDSSLDMLPAVEYTNDLESRVERFDDYGADYSIDSRSRRSSTKDYKNRAANIHFN